MNLSAKNILYIDLTNKAYEVKSEVNLHKYIGGAGVGLKILSDMQDDDPIIFSIGPLNGFFPYASKTSIVLNDSGVIEDIYLGGSLSTRIKFTGLDSIVITGKAAEPVIIDIDNDSVSFKSADTNFGSLGLPGRRSIISFINDKLLLDKYFSPPERCLESKFTEKNIHGLVITGSKNETVTDFTKYTTLYKNLLARINDVTVSQNTYPSCSGCPVGCVMSKVGEMGGNVLIHSLTACTFAEKIYADISVIFSCVNCLGYDYTHEDIERLPKLVEDVLKKL